MRRPPRRLRPQQNRSKACERLPARDDALQKTRAMTTAGVRKLNAYSATGYGVLRVGIISLAAVRGGMPSPAANYSHLRKLRQGRSYGEDAPSTREIREQRRTRQTLDERALRVACLARFELLDPVHFTARQTGDRDAVAIENAVVGERRDLRTGHDRADEIQRVGCRKRDPGRGRRRAARLAQQGHRFRQGELLARHAGDETAAANLAARLEAPEHAQEVAPGREPRRLALEQAPEHDAITAQQRLRHMLDDLRFRVVHSADRCVVRSRTAQQGPAARVLDAEQRRATATPAFSQRLPAVRRREERPQSGEAVRI